MKLCLCFTLFILLVIVNVSSYGQNANLLLDKKTTIATLGASTIFLAKYDTAGNLYWVQYTGVAEYDGRSIVIASDKEKYSNPQNLSFQVTDSTLCNGNWTDSSIWSMGSPPSPTDYVLIKHNVLFNESVKMISPGTIFITSSGELCGTDSLTTEITNNGPLNVGRLNLYGNSVSNAPVKILGGVQVNGNWTLNAQICFGCQFTCKPIIPCIPPVVNFSSIATVCSGKEIIFSDQSTNAPSVWSWIFPGGTPSSSGQKNPAITYNQPGIYNVTLIASNAFGSDTISKTNYIRVDSLPVVHVSHHVSLCPGYSTTFIAQGANTYSWAPSLGLNSTTGVSVIATPTVTNTYSVVGTDANGCSNSDSVNVHLFTSPSISISGGAGICSGQNATLIALSSGSYLWNTGSTSSAISISPSNTTAYSVTVTSADGCTNTGSSIVVVTATPVATVSADAAICLGETLFLAASGGANYSWSNGETTSIIQLTPNTTTTYSVIVSNGNCSDTASASIIVNPNPTATASGNATIFEGQTTTLIAGGGTSYLWSNGETAVSLVVAPVVTTIYCVTVADANNCNDTICVTIDVKSPCDTAGTFFFPNAFSPNGDGENEFLKIYYRNMDCIESLHLTIYDRWGEKVYETSDKNFQWDGKFHGKLTDTKVLSYFLWVQFTDGKQMDRRGNISLVR